MGRQAGGDVKQPWWFKGCLTCYYVKICRQAGRQASGRAGRADRLPPGARECSRL